MAQSLVEKLKLKMHKKPIFTAFAKIVKKNC